MYIQIEMDLLDMSSVGSIYPYDVKIKKKLSRGISRSFGLPILYNRIMVKVALTYKEKDRESTTDIKKISPSHMKIRVIKN
jgi:hypothetical protein